MPKRGGRSRGGTHGGSARGGGGSFRGFNLSKSLKRRASKNKSATHRDVPELMDLGAGGYLPETGSTMTSLSQRPNKRMVDEARYTDRHMGGTMGRPLRHRPVEFIKAKDVYDPGRELAERIKRYAQKEGLARDMENLDVQSETGLAPATDVRTEPVLLAADALCATVSENETQPENETGPENDTDSGLKAEQTPAGGAAKLPPAKATPIPDFIGTTSVPPSQDASGSHARLLDVRNNLEADALLRRPSCGLPQDALDAGEKDDAMAEGFADVVSGDEVQAQAMDSAMEAFFTIDDSGDQDVFKKHPVAKKATAALLKGSRPKLSGPRQSAANEPASATEHDPYLMVGNVMLRTLTDEFGNMSTNLPRTKAKYGSSLNFSEPLDNYYEEESEDTDEEAAFEDYKSQLLRGVDFNDSFGEEESLNDDIIAEEFADLDSGESLDFSIDDSDVDSKEGLDTRATNRKQIFNDYNVYVSSDQDSDNELLNSEEEGLEDILAFARNQRKVKNHFDVAPTETIRKIGKGKKQKLELGSHLELELRESLMEQFQYQRQSKRDKKLRKKEKRQREGVELHDLTIKYDYSLHINDIRQEFEAFLHDATRDTMSFPPLDGHGNKTINKLAGHFNMKCIRCGGNGLSLFMKVAKTKKTFRYIPAYDLIGYIMKQRPVFRRVDVKPRTKEEIELTDGKKERRGPRSETVIREGDIVGGMAPEIGNNNIGRQLLERLGWVKGEGLGALGNKGISEPLTATVKRSKTGLK